MPMDLVLICNFINSTAYLWADMSLHLPLAVALPGIGIIFSPDRQLRRLQCHLAKRHDRRASWWRRQRLCTGWTGRCFERRGSCFWSEDDPDRLTLYHLKKTAKVCGSACHLCSQYICDVTSIDRHWTSHGCEVTSNGSSIINLVLIRHLWFTLWTPINAHPSNLEPIVIFFAKDPINCEIYPWLAIGYFRVSVKCTRSMENWFFPSSDVTRTLKNGAL